MKIRKVIIPAAGFGTRFLPITKAMPKEMLPIVEKPVIQYVVEEAVAAGIEDVIIVTGASKRAIEDHFDSPNADLINNLKAAGKEKLVKEIQAISEMANFIYIRQKGPYGNGTPILSAEPVVDNEMFAVMWGDDFIYSDPPRLAQMMKVHETYGGAVLSAIRIKNKADLSKYGIARVSKVSGSGNVFKIEEIVEKPKAGEAPSDLALISSYILPPEIFGLLRKQKPGKNGEIFLTAAINDLIKSGYPVYACEIQNGKFYDTGNKLEYIKTVIDFALKHEEIKDQITKYMQDVLNDQAK